MAPGQLTDSAAKTGFERDSPEATGSSSPPGKDRIGSKSWSTFPTMTLKPKVEEDEGKSAATPSKPSSESLSSDQKLPTPTSDVKTERSQPIFGQTSAMSSPLGSYTGGTRNHTRPTTGFGGLFSVGKSGNTAFDGASPFASLKGPDKPFKSFSDLSSASATEKNPAPTPLFQARSNQSTSNIPSPFTSLDALNAPDAPSSEDKEDIASSAFSQSSFRPSISNNEKKQQQGESDGKHRSEEATGVSDLNSQTTAAPIELPKVSLFATGDETFSGQASKFGTEPRFTNSLSASDGKFNLKSSTKEAEKSSTWTHPHVPPFMPAFAPRLLETEKFQAITAMSDYSQFSFEELRYADYRAGRGLTAPSLKLKLKLNPSVLGKFDTSHEVTWYRGQSPKFTSPLSNSFLSDGFSYPFPELGLLAGHIDNHLANEPFKTVYSILREADFVRKIRSATDETKKTQASNREQDLAAAQIARKRLDFYNQCLSIWIVSKHVWMEHYVELATDLHQRRPVTATEVFGIRRSLDEWEQGHLEALAENLEAEKKCLDSVIEEIRGRNAFGEPGGGMGAKYWKVLAALDAL